MNPPDDALVYREASVQIAAPPAEVYGLVSNLERMGEWSPEATGGRWLEGGTGAVGDWFEGDNRSGEREWSRQSQVAVAEVGSEFTFVVGGLEASYTWWSYQMSAEGEGTKLTERWWIVNKSPALQQMSDEQIQKRVEFTESSIAASLAGIKATAEAG